MSDTDFSRRMPADPTRFVLVGTSHAGNVGAAARAMKVMGFSDLVLVAPRYADVQRRAEEVPVAEYVALGRSPLRSRRCASCTS